MTTSFTLLHDGETATIEVHLDLDADLVRIAPEDIRDQLGWELKPEGLCRGDVCVPVVLREQLVSEDGIDLAALADALGRPLALDPGERAAALGTAATERGALLERLEAPDFSLPDLEGRMHSLSEQRGKKVLLIAYASW